MAVYFGLAATDSATLAAAVDQLRARGLGPTEVSPVIETPSADHSRAETMCRVVLGGPFGDVSGTTSTLPDPFRHLGPAVDAIRLDLATRDETDPFLLPLLHLKPKARLASQSGTAFECSTTKQPLWMGILNITPDSFSDGARWDNLDHLEATVSEWIEAGVHLIDLGAESTRPNAVMVDPEIEWRRLEPVIHILDNLLTTRPLRPLISLDSRNVETLEKGLKSGVDLINDVTGLEHPDMVSLVRSVDVPVIAMHAMTVPVVPSEVLTEDVSAVIHIDRWLEKKLLQWDAAGIDRDRVIIDPGIGFGKTPTQSLDLMANVDHLRAHGQRVVIGHSRKSFMNGFSEHPSSARDPETLGISLALAQRGADIIRVHDPLLHLRAHRAAQQLDRFYE